MTWAARRRIIIVCIVIAFLGSIVYWHELPNIFKAPTCSDGIQNGDETGIDCGGTMCSTMCTADITLPTVLWVRSFPVTPDVFNAAAYIQNKNDAATRAIPYEFRLYDSKSILIARRDGVAIVPPLGNYMIVEPGIQTGSATVASTTFDFSATPATWERVPDSEGKLRVSTSNSLLDVSGSIPKLSATVTNPSPTVKLYNTTVAAVLYDADDNAVNVSRTVIPVLGPQASTPVVFTWPQTLGVPIVRSELLPIIDIFNAK